MSLDAGGREAEIHPMYDLVVDASYIERTTAMHWNFSGDELGIMHYIEGDVEAFRADVESIQEVLDYELTLASEDAFYAYIRDATNEPLRELFGAVTRSPVVRDPAGGVRCGRVGVVLRARTIGGDSEGYRSDSHPDYDHGQ